MKVVIDARRLQDRPLFGVGRGLANLVPHIAACEEVVLLCDRRRPLPASPGCQHAALRGFGPLPEVVWLQVSVPWWLRGSDVVFHGPYNAIPFATRGARVVTIHDLSWEHHSEDFTPLRRAALRAQGRWSARHADVVVTVSNFVRDGILEDYGIDADRVVVAPNAVDPVFSPTKADLASEILRPYGVTGPYVVALGGATRRGLPVAVEAWKQATAECAPRPALVVVGTEPPPDEVGVVHVGRVEDSKWSAILAGATAFCYPTRYEGFGMPALEAAASGAPVVCAPVASLPEILGSAAEWADTTKADDIAGALHRVLADPERQGRLRAAGLERAAAAPVWADSATVLINAYRRAAA